MRRPGLRERVRYRFDNFMSRGTPALIFGLFVVSLAIVVVFAIVVRITHSVPKGQPRGFGHVLWGNVLRSLDSGTVAGDTGSVLFLASMMAVTIGGIFVLSALIGVLSTGLEAKLDELRKGRSRVIESGHTVILGWSQEIYTILSEIITANANKRRSLIVILADRDKVEMEDDVRERLGTPRRTRIVCRRGDPTDLDEIDIAGVQQARSVIVLSPDNDDPDPDVLKSLLAIVNDPNRRSAPYHVVAQIRDPDNADVAKMIGKDEVELVLVDDLISRITAQTCRQSGLSIVYTELLDFDGDEIYFAKESSLVGKTYGEALAAFRDSALIGLHNGSAELNPPMETPITADHELILISEDDDTIHLGGPSTADGDAIVADPDAAPAPERTLVLGWNRRASQVVSELDNYVASGSIITIVAEAVTPPALANMTATVIDGDPTDRATLDGLDVTSFDHVIILSAFDSEEAQRADARTLITLLHLRDIATKTGARFSITTEMVDVRNRTLAEVAKADDFIVSDRLVSLMMAQVSENKHLSSVFADLFDADGSEVYLKPATRYVAPGTSVDFYTVLEAAKRRGETAIGYRKTVQANDASSAYGVVVNPDKTQPVTFDERDKVIVLAED
jgi:voltage-gated potassium channel Kch